MWYATPARIPSSWRSRRSLDSELQAQGVVGMRDVDTRALTRHIRERAAMRVGVSSVETSAAALLERVQAQPSMTGAHLADEVSTTEPYVVRPDGEPRFRVVAVDLGIKSMTPARMAERGLEVHVVPSTVSLSEMEALHPDGVFFSNGPGDPQAAHRQVALLQIPTGGPHPVLRHLLRQSALRSGAWLRHLQVGLRASRHQPASNGPQHPQGRGHGA